MGKFESDDFIKVNLPPVESSLPFQDASFLPVLSIRGSHAVKRDILLPKGSPRYVRGKEPTLEWRDLAAFRSQFSRVLMPRISLLWKLTWSPKANWKRMRFFLTFRRWSRFWGVKIIVSSANWRWVIEGPFLQTSTPFQKFRPGAFLISRFKTSHTRTKRRGDKGSPCLRPFAV